MLSLSLLDFHCSVRALLPPLRCTYSQRLKSYAAIWSCLTLGGEKKQQLGFFHKWLYRAEKTNTSVRCRSHKTSESAVGSGPLSCRLTGYETLQMSRYMELQTHIRCGHPAHVRTKTIIHIVFLKCGVQLPRRLIIYATMKCTAEEGLSIWLEHDRGEEQML